MCPALHYPAGTDRVAAFSNRAAAHLVLGRFQDAESDCGQGLAVALSGLSQHCSHLVHRPTISAEATNSSQTEQAAETQTVGIQQAADTLQGLVRLLVEAASGTSGVGARETADAALHDWVRQEGKFGACGFFQACRIEEEQQAKQAEAAAPQPQTANRGGDGDGSVTHQVTPSGAVHVPSSARLASVGRLLARRGAIRGHMRSYCEGEADYHAAAELFTVLGDASRATALEADASKLAELSAGQGEGGAAVPQAPPESASANNDVDD